MPRAASLTFAALGLGLLAVPSIGHAAGDNAAGRDLALTWCSACHAVPGGPAASDAAPTLATVARSAAAAPGRIRAFLAVPHGEMAELHLSNVEIENLIAYLQTLR